MPTAGARNTSGFDARSPRWSPLAMIQDDDFATLNAIYLKKMATAEMIAEITGLATGVVQDRLDAAEAFGWIVQMPSGAMLLEDGTRAVLETYRDGYAG